ncbi:MAG: pyridoxamine 5'-phosphate oxidase family protein [Candidatus Scalindua sp.]|nr:pyridoxamine 5'-phosphate oxidase family protein [Candidatus Scalindua sp.]
MSDVKTKTRDYLDSVKTVSLATSMESKPSCRIMEIQKVEDDLKILFVAHKSSSKMEQIEKNSSVCIVSFNEETVRDIRLFGKIEVLLDMETKKYVWNEGLEPYFPGGINDPELTVLKFNPEKLEYRDMKVGGLLPEIENL